jgi:hypothetical protein
MADSVEKTAEEVKVRPPGVLGVVIRSNAALRRGGMGVRPQPVAVAAVAD